MFTALITVGAFIKIPIMTVPFTMQFLFTNLAGILLGVKYGTLSLVLYLVLGLAGVPIFTAGGGIGYVLQPTFGYLIGFTVGAFVSALICSKGRYSYARLVIAGVANLIIVYALGMLYFDLLMRFYFGSPKDGGWIFVNLCLIFLFLRSQRHAVYRNHHHQHYYYRANGKHASLMPLHTPFLPFFAAFLFNSFHIYTHPFRQIPLWLLLTLL